MVAATHLSLEGGGGGYRGSFTMVAATHLSLEGGGVIEGALQW